eukprot:SAG31_NODE_218_length_19934_cov_81.634837_8_plen_107_part_00
MQKLSGVLPSQWACPHLLTITLAYNYISGTIPVTIFSGNPSLKIFRVDYNPMPTSEDSMRALVHGSHLEQVVVSFDSTAVSNDRLPRNFIESESRDKKTIITVAVL